MKEIPLRYFALVTVVLFSILAFAAPPEVIDQFSGKVIGITDGDTIKVLINKETVKVRLEGIDAPESRQSFGWAPCSAWVGPRWAPCSSQVCPRCVAGEPRVGPG